jgi:hypothetical protein
MTKHASTSICVGKDGGSGCGGVPLPLPSPPLPCSPPSLCTPSLPSSFDVVAVVTVASSPRRGRRQRQQQRARRPAATAAAVIAAVNVEGGSARVAARPICPLWPVAAASPMRIGIILVSAAAAVLPPHPRLPLTPATTGGVAIDVYRHN